MPCAKHPVPFVDHFGYATFFNATAVLGLPVLLLVALALRSTRANPALPEGAPAR